MNRSRHPQLRSPALRTPPRVLEAGTPPHAFNKSESIVEPVWSPQTQHYVRNVAVLTYRRLPRKNGCSKIYFSQGRAVLALERAPVGG